MSYKLEVCCATLQDVANAVAGGANRIELCAALSCGGVTPTLPVIEAAREICRETVKLHVLIRVREGDFHYSDAETATMVREIEMARRAGVDGVVIGALTPDGHIDMNVCQQLVEAANGHSVTFSRAFDLCPNPMGELERVITLGCHRLLTSGSAPDAMTGISNLKALVENAAERIIILAASGINLNNYFKIIKETGVKEIHGSFRRPGKTSPLSLPGLEPSSLYTSKEDVSLISKTLKSL